MRRYGGSAKIGERKGGREEEKKEGGKKGARGRRRAGCAPVAIGRSSWYSS